MFKVRIKTSPGETNPKSTGQQEDYGLVRNLRGMQNSPEQYAVNDTMGAIPRDQANIEVEGGESVIGDINNDGTMELMHFNGKRHTEGGIPVNIPEGSFIFSDTKNLTIKDPEVLEKIFNLPFRKQGYTPGEISKKYDINIYVQILKDDTSDPLAKRSAAEMLKKNKQKLGLLAFIQESMKGFPDGIPAIAEEVLSSMGIDPNQMAQQFAPQQPQGQMMPPPQEGQGIPMSEDESAMQGMMPEGPAVAPEDLANQFSGKFGGVMPRYEYEDAGTVNSNSGCPPMYTWNSYVKKCVLAMYGRLQTVPDFAIAGYNFDKGIPDLPNLYLKAQKQKKQKQKEEEFDANALLSNAQTQRVRIKEAPLSEEEKAYEYFLGKPVPAKVEPIPGSMQLQGDPYAKKYDKETGEELKNITYDKAAEERKAAERLAKEELRLAKEKRDDPYKDNIPGFGSASNLKSYMSENYQQQVAGDTFYKALLSNDPGQMIQAADDIKNIDIPWNVGWLPWSDQDKIDDMYTILHEEALKKLNEKQKDIILKDYSVNTIKTKLNDVITKYQKLRDDATDVATKLKYAEILDRYTTYKKELFSNETYNDYIGSVKNSYVSSNANWFAHDLPFMDNEIGNPIQDMFMGDPAAGNNETIMSIVEDITKAHDLIKNTNTASTSPLAFKSQMRAGPRTMSDGASFETWSTEGEVKSVYDKLYGQKNTPKDAKGYMQEYKLNAAPGSTFVMNKNLDGQMIWFEVTEDGADLEVTNPEWVATLNAAATNKEGRKVFLRPAKGPVDIIEMLEEEKRLNPPLDPTNTKPKTDVIAPVGKPKQKYETEGVDDALFDDLFGKGSMKYGGTMKSIGSDITIGDKVFRYGGLINENGKLRYDRGGSVLPKFAGGGSPTGPTDPVKGPETVVTVPGKNGGKPMIQYEETYASADGNPAHTTVIQVLKDQASGNIIGRRNATTKEAVPNNAEITRSSYDWITADQLNASEKKEVESRWNGNTQAYIDFKNANNQIRLDSKFSNAIVDQYIKDVEDPQKRMFTGREQATRDKFSNLYSTSVKALAQKPEEIINTMMQFEENNARMAAFGYGDRTSGSGPWSDPNFKAGQNVATKTNSSHGDYQGKYVNTEAREIIKNNQSRDGKINLSDIDFSKNELGQGTYISYRRALINNPQFQGLASHKQTGVNDETVFGIQGQVSGIDRFSTNTTLEERLGYNLTPPDKPGEKQAFYCVDYDDGTKDIETVTYPDTGQPTAPVVGSASTKNGKIITASIVYSDLATAQANCKPKDEPGEKEAYYCVDYTDGTKDVQTVKYKDGAQPVPPAVGAQIGGKTVKASIVYASLSAATENCTTGKIPPPLQPPGWFAPDIVNYAAASRQIIPNTPPTLRQIAQPISGYDTINPITKIAGTTGLMRQQGDLAMNTMDATTGFAAMSGQGYDKLAEQIGGVEEYNVTNIVNPYLARIGNLATDVDYKNTMLRGKFDTEGAVYQEELAAQRNKKAAQEAMLFGQGWGNVQKDNALRVENPNAWHANRLQPTFQWSGIGKNPLITSSTTGVTQEDCSAVYTQALDVAKANPNMDDAARKTYADTAMKNCMARNNAQVNRTQQQKYNTGVTNMFGTVRYGGTMYTAPGAMEYGGMFYDDDNN